MRIKETRAKSRAVEPGNFGDRDLSQETVSDVSFETLLVGKSIYLHDSLLSRRRFRRRFFWPVAPSCAQRGTRP